MLSAPNGFIGSHLVDGPVAVGHYVNSFDRLSAPPRFLRDSHVEIVFGDYLRRRRHYQISIQSSPVLTSLLLTKGSNVRGKAFSMSVERDLRGRHELSAGIRQLHESKDDSR